MGLKGKGNALVTARDISWLQSYLWGRLWLHWSWTVTKPLWAHLTLPSSWSPIQGAILTGLLITFLLIDLSLIAKQHSLHQHACCSWLQCAVSWVCYGPVLTHDLWEVTEAPLEVTPLISRPREALHFTVNIRWAWKIVVNGACHHVTG